MLHSPSKYLVQVACLWSKMPMFHRAGMMEGRLPPPPAFQYLILMIWRACDLNLVMISSLASKCQDFKLRGLQFQFIKQLKNGHPNFEDLPFWSQWRYHKQIYLTSSACHKNQISKSRREWQLCLPYSYPFFINRPPRPNILTATVYQF